MNALRQSYLDNLRTKQLVAKSAAPTAIAVRDGLGNVMGFATPETVSPAEAKRIAELANDPNDCFNDSAAFPFDDSPSPRETVQKSAPNPNDPNNCLTNLFPFVDIQKSATPDAAELMNRVSGRNAEDSKPAGRPGRPRTAAKVSPIKEFQQALAAGNPRSVIEIDPQNGKIVAGSVMQTLLPDGETVKFIILTDDVSFDVLDLPA